MATCLRFDNVQSRTNAPSAEEILKGNGFCLRGEKELYVQQGTAAQPRLESCLRWFDSITKEDGEDEK
jgi:hypothetical protein